MNSSTEKALSVLRADPYLAQEMDSIVEYWIGPARYSAAGGSTLPPPHTKGSCMNVNAAAAARRIEELRRLRTLLPADHLDADAECLDEIEHFQTYLSFLSDYSEALSC